MKRTTLLRLVLLVAGSLFFSLACGSQERRVARRSCKIERECVPNEFSSAYYSMEDCVDQALVQVIDAVDQQVAESSEECGDAYVELLLCSTKKGNCAAPYYTDYEECDEQLDAAAVVCN